MLFNQPGDLIGTLLFDLVVLAKCLYHSNAELGVVATAPLGDVVEESGNIELLGVFQLNDQVAEVWELLVML